MQTTFIIGLVAVLFLLATSAVCGLLAFIATLKLSSDIADLSTIIRELREDYPNIDAKIDIAAKEYEDRRNSQT